MALRRLYFALLALLALLPLATAPATASAQRPARCFPETGFCINGPIRDYWERNGGLPVFGYPITEQRTETIEGRWTGPVQWFERDRLEDHANEGIGVLAGRLGDRYLQLQGINWQQLPGDNAIFPGCRFFRETQFNLCGAFLTYWERNGGLERFGYPLTSQRQEFIQGREYTVQYFERRRMEYHPENAGTPYDVLLGLLGREVFRLEGGQVGNPGSCQAAVRPLDQLARSFREQLGCPTAGGRTNIPLAEQAFEYGTMVWVANEDVRGGKIFVIFSDNSSPSGFSWRVFDDTYIEGEPVNTDVLPPPGLFVPVRGFGKLWRDNVWVRSVLGYGITPERGDLGAVQPFQNGRALMIHRAAFDRGLVLFPVRDSGAGPAYDLPAR